MLEKRRDLLLLHVVGLLTSSSVLFYSALLLLLQSVCVWSCVAHGAQHDYALNSPLRPPRPPSLPSLPTSSRTPLTRAAPKLRYKAVGSLLDVLCLPKGFRLPTYLR